MPFLIWARTFYNKASDRFYAPDLMLNVSSKAKEKGYTFFLYGGYPGAPEKMEEFLKKRFEGVKSLANTHLLLENYRMRKIKLFAT